MNLPEQFKPSTQQIKLPSGLTVPLPVCHPVFNSWLGAPVAFNFGNKAILAYKGEACFAELVIQRLLSDNGWESVWVETFGGLHFLKNMPTGWSLKSQHVSIPCERENLLRKILNTDKKSACFDVFAWRDDEVLFCEAKRAGKDTIRHSQKLFIQGALTCGIALESLLIVEWRPSIPANVVAEFNADVDRYTQQWASRVRDHLRKKVSHE
jgi:hypothetical protein